ncbi:MAG: hypothetical protein HYV28_04600 [Ignavibacteriales bacterium]|nr:hypothetical protein [Ignavibacteriales bacterium]
MKTGIHVLAVLAIGLPLFVIGCNVDREKKVEDAKETVDNANKALKDAQAEYDKDYQVFKNNAETKISANEKSIEEFKVEIKSAGKKFKAGYEKEIAALEQKNLELKKKIIEYKYAGKDQWEDFKVNFNKEMESVGSAIKDFFAKK